MANDSQFMLFNFVKLVVDSEYGNPDHSIRHCTSRTMLCY